MSALHIVHGGVENGDKRWLERAARLHRRAKTWIVPKSARPGDEVVIFVGGFGFFATGRIASLPTPRSDWPNRYSAGLDSIRLISPAISLAGIARGVSEFAWTNYPRSITTPAPGVAAQIRALIARRRKTGLPDLDDESLAAANMDESLRVALLSARSVVARTQQLTWHRARSRAIHRFVLLRAEGHCEACGVIAPFQKPDGSAYLEPHHATRLADDGPDHPAKVIALCPNCHRRAHHAKDATTFNRAILTKLAKFKPASVYRARTKRMSERS